MQIHGFITFLTSRVFHESRATSLNLNATSCLLLDMLNISTSMSNYLSTKIKAWKCFKADRDLLLGPFTLLHILVCKSDVAQIRLTLPNSSLSTCSGSRRRNRRSSTRLGSSCFISSSIFSTASSRPLFVVLVTCR